MFYSNLLLADEQDYSNKYTSQKGALVPPTPDEFMARLKTLKVPYSVLYQGLLDGKYKIAKLWYNVTKNETHDTAQIDLKIRLIPTAKQGYKTHYDTCVVRCQLSTVSCNCGTLHLSNIHQGETTGFASILMKAVLNYANIAGYTMLLGNTAGEQNSIAWYWFRDKFGAIPFGVPYKNNRSGNVNLWFAIPVGNKFNPIEGYEPPSKREMSYTFEDESEYNEDEDHDD